ncbi:MAG: NusG domain II-containing protein [Clostridia bacterium]|nr:NusG domain II-containing protein [Clostridia bacterium]
MKKLDKNKVTGGDASPSVATRKFKNDMILIGGLLLVIALGAMILFLLRTPGDTVVVTVDGRAFGEYPLSRDREVELHSENGYNLLIIREGKAYVSQASCPDGICSSHRPISKSGESIICLPNKVVVEIRTQNKNQPDLIS